MAQHHRRWLIILGLALVAGFLRWDMARTMPGDWDEDDYLIPGAEMRRAVADEDWRGVTDVQINYEHPPLVKYLYGLTIPADELADFPRATDTSYVPLPPDSLRYARYQAVTVGTLAVVVVALINPLAALFLVVQSMHVYFASVAYLDALPVLFTALMAYFYLRGQRRSLWWAGMCLGVACAAKYPYAVSGVALALHALWYKRYTWRQLAVWGVVALITFYIFNPYIWLDPIGRLQHQFGFHEGYASGRDPQFFTAFNQLLVPRKHLRPDVVDFRLPMVIDPLIFGLAMVGVYPLFKQRSYFLWWLVLGIAFLTVWPTQWIQHKMIVVVPFVMSAAAGGQWLWGMVRRRWARPSSP